MQRQPDISPMQHDGPSALLAQRPPAARLGPTIFIAVSVAVLCAAATLFLLSRDGDAPLLTDGTLSGVITAVDDGTVTLMLADGAHRTLPVEPAQATSPALLSSLMAAHRSVEATVADGRVTDVAVAAPPGAQASAPGRVVRANRTSITLRTAAGVLRFKIAPDDLTRMDVPHMLEHRAAGSGVVIRYDMRGGTRWARSFADAAAPA